MATKKRKENIWNKKLKEIKIPKRYITYGIILLALIILAIAVSNDNSIEREGEMKDFGETQDLKQVGEVPITKSKTINNQSQSYFIEDQIVNIIMKMVPVSIFFLVVMNVLGVMFKGNKGGSM